MEKIINAAVPFQHKIGIGDYVTVISQQQYDGCIKVRLSENLNIVYARLEKPGVIAIGEKLRIVNRIGKIYIVAHPRRIIEDLLQE